MLKNVTHLLCPAGEGSSEQGSGFPLLLRAVLVREQAAAELERRLRAYLSTAWLQIQVSVLYHFRIKCDVLRWSRRNGANSIFQLSRAFFSPAS